MNTGLSSEGRLPRWRLDTIYGGFDDASYLRDKARLPKLITAFRLAATKPPPSEPSSLADWLEAAAAAYNKAADLLEELSAFAYTNFSTDTRDAKSLAEVNDLDRLAVPLTPALVRFRTSLAAAGKSLSAAIASRATLKPYSFVFKEAVAAARRQMSPELEELAAELSRAGGEAWGRLHQAMTSTATAAWSETETKTVTELRLLAHDPDRAVRERAYRLELDAWKRLEAPLAAALNGVKGFSVTLDGRRGYKSSLERAVVQSRMSRKTLDALLEAIRDGLPVFRRYLRLKAKLLGVERLAFYDIFAPVLPPGTKQRRWTFAEAAVFIVTRFAGFDTELSDFARRAFDDGWIDAEPRAGKVGGAYCIGFPRAKESRVLANYDFTANSVMTLAHELGHAFHHHVLKDRPHLIRSYPMTLAETASIFAETIVFNGALDHSPTTEKVVLVEGFLQDATQVLVDILSRFHFESALFDRRPEREVPAAELCEMMTEGQIRTYGKALDPKFLHPYMWAVKGHYYSQDRAFYNFPYAFGQLFGLALYERYRTEGAAFPSVYRALLAQTGSESANTVTKRAGFDIENAAFWQGGIATVERYVDRFEELSKT